MIDDALKLIQENPYTATASFAGVGAGVGAIIANHTSSYAGHMLKSSKELRKLNTELSLIGDRILKDQNNKQLQKQYTDILKNIQDIQISNAKEKKQLMDKYLQYGVGAGAVFGGLVGGAVMFESQIGAVLGSGAGVVAAGAVGFIIADIKLKKSKQYLDFKKVNGEIDIESDIYSNLLSEYEENTEYNTSSQNKSLLNRMSKSESKLKKLTIKQNIYHSALEKEKIKLQVKYGISSLSIGAAVGGFAGTMIPSNML